MKNITLQAVSAVVIALAIVATLSGVRWGIDKIAGTTGENWEENCGGMYESRARTCAYWDARLESWEPSFSTVTIVASLFVFVLIRIGGRKENENPELAPHGQAPVE